jgi:predicted amidohydrolase YtcJ
LNPLSRQIGLDKDLGTLEVGTFADLVVLSADLFFLAQIEAIDPSEHKDL